MNSTPTPSTLSLQVLEPKASRIIRLFLYAGVFVLTVGGNLMVCIVVMRNRKLRSMQRFYYGYFLMNLAFADLAVALLCIPFTIVYYETGIWPFGPVICKMVPTLQVASVSASIFTLTVMTYERYQAIVRPLKVQITKRKVLTMLGMAWFLAFISASPEIFAFQLQYTADEKYPCKETWPHHKYRQLYTMFLFVCTYLVPLLIIFPAYMKMMATLKKSFSFNSANGSDQKQRWRSLRVLLAVVIIFAVSYLPQHIMFIAMDFGNGLRFPYFVITLKYCYLLVWIASCSNPIIYGALDEYFRQRYRSILRRCIAVKKSGQNVAHLMSNSSAVSYVRSLSNPAGSTTPRSLKRLLSISDAPPSPSPSNSSVSSLRRLPTSADAKTPAKSKSLQRLLSSPPSSSDGFTKRGDATLARTLSDTPVSATPFLESLPESDERLSEA